MTKIPLYLIQLNRESAVKFIEHAAQFGKLALHRITELLRLLPSCTFRTLGIVLFASIALAHTREAVSPHAPPFLSDKRETNQASHYDLVNLADQYVWLKARQRTQYVPLMERIKTPCGYHRADVPIGSFAEWLRYLPVAGEQTPVTTPDSVVVLASDHPNLAAVIQLQPHLRRLLSGTNMMLRLRAEYLWSNGKTESIGFHFTSGQHLQWPSWSRGKRPILNGKHIRFVNIGIVDESRRSFCGYLHTLYGYASTMSLLDDTRPVKDDSIASGDLFLRTGRKGHALMVLDIATNEQGQVRALLGEGGLPVQTFHVLRSDEGSPWFPIAQSNRITLEGRGAFTMRQLRRWEW